MRARILKNIPIFSVKLYKEDVQKLNTNCNVAHLAEYLLEGIPSCIKTNSCATCFESRVRKLTFVSINVNLLLEKEFEHIQEAVDIAHTQFSIYKFCNGPATLSAEFGPHIIVDTSIIPDENYLNSLEVPVKPCRLNCIQKTLVSDNSNYILSGIVSYRNAHYKTIIFNGIKWLIIDDMVNKLSAADPNETIFPHVVFYRKQ